MEEGNSQPPDHQLEPAQQVEAIVTPGAAAAAADAPVYDVYMDEEEEEKKKEGVTVKEKEEGEEGEEAEKGEGVKKEMEDGEKGEKAEGVKEMEDGEKGKKEEEADRQGIDATAAAPIYDVYMEEEEEEEVVVVLDVAAKEEADRQNRAAAIAADEEMAHRLYMQELMAMDEWQLRYMDRPSLRAALDLPLSDFASSSRAGVGASTTAQNPRNPVVLPRSVTMADNRGARTYTTSGFMRPGPRDFATTPARKTTLSKDAAGSSSTQHVTGDGKASTVPSETPAPASVVPSAGCGATAPPARAKKTVPDNAYNGPVSSKRRALLADADSAIVFAAMEEGHNNRWYESMVVPDDDEKPEHVEVQGLDESLQQCLPGSEPCKPAATVAQGRGFSLQDFCQRWGVTPSDLEPDEAGPSTRAPKVPPLADHEVPTFDCGICMDTLPVFDLFHGLPCKHKFCASCMTTYVEGRIRSTELPIPCPDPACGRGGASGGRGVLHPEKCKKAIDYGAFVDWGTRLTENALPPDRRAYCPNRRCGVLLETSGDVEPAKAFCPACGEALCATCGMEWSSDGTGLGMHDCVKGPDAALVRQLAHERQWKQCPNCKMYVERIDGCNRMTCRCNFVFCYRCGRPCYVGQVGGEGLEACRCNDAGLAFAWGHQHQAHVHPIIVDQMMQLPPVDVDLHMAPPPPEVALNRDPRWDEDPAEENDWLN